MVILFGRFRISLDIFDLFFVFFIFFNEYEVLEANFEAIHTNVTWRIHWKGLKLMIQPFSWKLHFYNLLYEFEV